MSRYLSLLLFIILTVSLITKADAGRFGGGRSFGFSSGGGYSRSFSGFGRAEPGYTRSRSIIGPILGLALGAVIGTLFFNHGITSLLAWISLLAGIFYVRRMLLRMRNPGYEPVNMQNMAYQQQQQRQKNIISFDSAGFLTMARSLFLRLQTAYDNKDEEFIRQNTTRDVFAEIQAQFVERGLQENVTLVEQLNATVQNVNDKLVSVIFSGLICEERGGIAKPFNEIWQFRQSWDGQQWLVAGIQQI